MRKSKLIKEMTVDEFKAQYGSKIVYAHRKLFFNEKNEEIPSSKTGEFVTDSRGEKHWVSYSGCYSKIMWVEESLLEIVLEIIEFSKKENSIKNHGIAVALHTEPTEEEKKEYNKTELMFAYSYLDKYLTPMGNQTYLVMNDIKHIYVGRRKFYATSNYFEASKTQTKEMILIHY